MTRKKNKFFTFIFAALFGAGQMYMGFMKQGISIMIAAAVIMAAGSWTGIGTLFFVLPVLWFYSFFDAINKMTMPDRIFQTLEDQYIFLSSNDNVQLKYLAAKYEKAIAIFLILIGGSVLGENILDFIAEQASLAGNMALEQFADFLRWKGSRILFSIVIIVIGVKMIIGKKKELDQEENHPAGRKCESEKAVNSEILLNRNEFTQDFPAVPANTTDNPILITDVKENPDENA